MDRRNYDFATMTRREALDALADLDVARWGEHEREASIRLNGPRTRGSLINAIVHHALHDYGDAFDQAERALAAAQLTPEDRDDLRKGG